MDDETEDRQRLAWAQAEIARLKQALENSRLIGAAIGIAMQRYGLDRATALAFLKRNSQDNNRKLRDVAAEVVQSQDDLAHGARADGTVAGR